ncbi:MAG: DegT/DnrJ/EryC1/StrS aminotransferase family protein [Dermatophilaceae bacterium]|nr:DegT/DnrJ/EryC1/StrS aminotransferase family protein [Dermatophilaceae bacterium]
MVEIASRPARPGHLARPTRPGALSADPVTLPPVAVPPPHVTPHVAPHVVPFTRTRICAEARQAVADVLESGWVTSGQQVIEFESELAAYVGADHGIAVSSCTAAIELALRALELPAGSKVLMSTVTFCGAAAAIRHAGHVPVLADVDPVTAMPSCDTVAAAAAGCGGVDALVVVHLTGLPTDVRALADAAGVDLAHVVEDAAHALGTVVGDEPVGSISRATCFSFYATKNLAIGEGGMVTTDDPELAGRIRQARLHGMSADAWRRYLPGGGWRYDVAVDGLKANMTDVQAAIGRAQLRRFDVDQGRRAAVAARYDEGLSGIPGLRRPLRPLAGRHAWHLYTVRVEPAYGMGRDELIDALRARGVMTSVHFIPLHHLTWFRDHCIVPAEGLPGADRVFDRILSLPMDAVLTDAEVDQVCAALAESARRGGAR